VAVRHLAPTVLVALLLAATAAAFAFAQRAKLEDSPIQNILLERRLVSPICTACSPAAREVPVRMRLLKEDHVTVDIVDMSGTPVRERVFAGRYTPRSLRFSWDGRDSDGRVAADGLYRLRVKLADEGRTLEVPEEIRVDGTAPTIEDVEVEPKVISPDGDRRSDRVSISYRFGEPAYAVLFVDGKRRPGRSFRRRPAGTLQWYAVGLRPGTYRLALAAQDPSGNQSPSTREFEMRVRFVELAGARFVVRPTAMFRVRVSTDSTRLAYTLAGRTVRLNERRAIRRFWVRAPAAPGRYRLVVRVGERQARATVVVRGQRR
jgi:FlgD Ig-like domain